MSLESDDLLNAIKRGRDDRFDWLSETASQDVIAAALTAMANHQGGTLVLGIAEPAAAVVGVQDAEATIDRVLQAALSVEPALIIPLPRVVRAQDKALVVVQIPRGLPHVYAYEGRYLWRQGSENVSLKPRDLHRLIIERGDAQFETEIARGAGLDDIDWDKAKAYVATMSSGGEGQAEKVLLKRGCLTLHDGRLRPTYAGILLFGKEPLRFVRGAEILAARFAGRQMTDSFERFEISGTLPDVLRRAEAFLIDHLRRGVRLGSSMVRDEQYEYPLEAARELVVNAVAHRDYSIDGNMIHLFLFQDRMEVLSPGRLPGPITVDNIAYERFSRNPALVQVLSDMGFIERLGYGVDRVIALMKQRQLRAPVFEELASGFRVTLYNQKIEEAVKPAEVKSPLPPDLHGKYRDVALNPRQESALSHLLSGHSRITNSDLQQMYPDVHPETIRRDLSDLVTKSILRKLGEKRGSYYVLSPASD